MNLISTSELDHIPCFIGELVWEEGLLHSDDPYWEYVGLAAGAMVLQESMVIDEILDLCSLMHSDYDPWAGRDWEYEAWLANTRK